ncbi:MAG: hypothetical protein WCW52_11650 [Elusimicrobiales bacterium]|jgi:hypothetical protein
MTISNLIKRPAFAALAAWLLICGPAAQVRCMTEVQDARLIKYEALMLRGDPGAADELLADQPLMAALAETDLRRAASLKAKAEALKDLNELLSMPWDSATVNKLSQALALRIDAGSPLAGAGVGPEPEKLFVWLARYQPGYPAEKTEVVKKAVRQWELVFDTETETLDIAWDQAEGTECVKISKTEWLTWTIKERNAVVSKILERNKMFLNYNDAALATMTNDISTSKAADKIIASGALSPEQAARLSGMRLPDQIYLLGGMFDGIKAAIAPDLKIRINANRNSLPKELLPAGRRAVLASMLNTAVSKELAGTRAGEEILAFYSRHPKMNLSVRPCDTGYSGYDPATGTILLDSETIQQFMRMNGYTADSLVTSAEQLRATAKYVSPLVVYQAAHQMRDSWAKKKGLYNPAVQESEIEAMSLEALYTLEKLKKDREFRELLANAREFSDYAAKRVELAGEFMASGSKKFSSTVRQRYCPGLPSLNAAAAQILEAVTKELGRRAALTPKARRENESSALNLEEALEMTPEELSGSAGEVGTAVLEKLRKDLMQLRAYEAGYEATDSAVRAALKNGLAGPAAAGFKGRP